MIEYILPFPPSTNNLFLNVRGRGRILSPEYRAWKVEARLRINEQHPRPFYGRALIQIDLDERRRGDCGNREKAVVDLLVDIGVLVDDSKRHVRRISIGWEPVDECCVRLCEASA